MITKINGRLELEKKLDFLRSIIDITNIKATKYLSNLKI